MVTRPPLVAKTKLVDGVRTPITTPPAAASTPSPALSALSRSIAPTTTPAPIQEPSSTQPKESEYYSRTTSNDPVDSYMSGMAFKAPESVESIQKKKLQDAQAEINDLNRYERTLLAEQKTINEGRSRETASVNTLTGLSGSSEANITTSRTDAANQKANQAISEKVALERQRVLKDVRTSAVEEARLQREEARLDATTITAAREKALTSAKSHIETLAKAGTDIKELMTADPEAYAHLAKQAGGEQMLNAMFTLNRPKEQILDKKLEGGKYIITWQNPVDNKIRIETVDTGLPVGYSETIDAGDRILAVPDNWDGDTAKLITINKGLTPAQKAKPVGGAGATPGGTYASDLDAVIGATLSGIPSKFGQATFQSQMAKARNDSDKINLVATQVLKGAPAEFRQDFSNQAVGISNVEKAIALVDSGVKTGVINDKLQYAFNVFGKDFDPKLAEINQRLTAAIQPYRNSVTGAAWGDQEDGEYQQLFGSTKYSPAELRQRLIGVKEILKSKSASGLNSFVNPMGYYDNQFETGNFSPSDGDVRSQAEAAGYNYDAMRTDGLSDEQIRASL